MIAAVHPPSLVWLGDDARETTLLPAPASNPGFTENHRCVIECDQPGYALYIDDEPIETTTTSAQAWAWTPGFFAGEVTAELRGADTVVVAVFLLDVGPNPTKMGRPVFDQMVRELWEADPTLVVGKEPATTLTGELGSFEDAWLAFARLRRYAPGLVCALAEVRERPRHALRVRRDTAPLHHVRRVDRHTAAMLVRGPAAALFGHGEAAAPIRGHERLDVPVVEDTLDAAPNRALLALTIAVRRRALSLISRLQHQIDHEGDDATRTSLARRWPARRRVLEETADRLAFAIQQLPFREVRRAEITAAGLTAIAADPIYSRAWNQGWRALRYGLEDGLSDERMWTSPSWEIYERWCFLRIGRMLAVSTPSWRWRLEAASRRWSGEGDAVRARLALQPTFRSSDAPRPGAWSISRERIPDLVLSIERQGVTRYIVLDAKYRASRQAILDSMASAHVYQDSLRVGDRRPECSLLVAPSTSAVAWLATPAFHAEHRVGVMALRPDLDATLPPVIAAAIAD
jgi:hypothetical protein